MDKRKLAFVSGIGGIGVGAAALAAIFAAAGPGRGITANLPSLSAPALSFESRATPRMANVSATEAESLAELRNLNESFKNLAKYASPAVVEIRGTSGRQQDMNGARMPAISGSGSGFIIRKDGYIVTNDHVVDGMDKVTVMLADGRELPGKVVRAFEFDLAVVKVEANDLPTLALANSDNVAPGELAMAIGAPFGMENTVTVGHVSALHRADRQIGNRNYPDMIQTDTSINMGNSGGPLINIDGQVIGVNTAIFSPTGTSAGIGFAIPANQVRLIVDQLISNGKLHRAYMGLTPGNLKPYRLKEMGIEGGAQVMSVGSSELPSPARSAGLQEGDVVTRIAGDPINSALDLRNKMLITPPGSTVDVEYLRNGQKKVAKVTVTEVPEQILRLQRGEAQPGDIQGSPRRNFQDFQFPDDLDSRQIPPEFRDFFRDIPRPNRAPQGRMPQGREEIVPPVSEGPRLGVSIGPLDAQTRRSSNIPPSVNGLFVGSVEPGSLADRAGLRPGDVITSLDGKPATSAEAVVQQIKGLKGKSARIEWRRYSTDGDAAFARKVQF